jgi:site-specific DNA recombinase
MIAACYARKSTEDKRRGTEEASVPQQIAEAQGCADDAGHVLQYTYKDEAKSGAEFAKRDGLMALVAALKPQPPFQVLYITDRDRLGREQIETSYIIKQIIQANVTIIETRTGKPLTLDSPVDKVILSVTAFAGELERQQARVRTRAAMVSKAKAGHVAGGVIYGYDNQGILSPEGKRLHVVRVIHPEQAKVVTKIFQRVADGAGFRKISHELNQAQLPAPRPSKNDRARGWCPSTVRAVVHRELYRGHVVWGKTIKRNSWGQKQSAQRAEAQRPESDWITSEQPELRIISDEL